MEYEKYDTTEIIEIGDLVSFKYIINEDNKYRCFDSKRKDNNFSHDSRYKGKLKYELANEAFYFYRKYIKRMNLF